MRVAGLAFRGEAARDAVLVEVNNTGGHIIDGEAQAGNGAHTIDGKVIPWKWTYTPQHKWLAKNRQPKYVLRNAHLNDDWDALLVRLNLPAAPLKWIMDTSSRSSGASTGVYKEEDVAFSTAAQEYLQGVYREDCAMFGALGLDMPSCAYR